MHDKFCDFFSSLAGDKESSSLRGVTILSLFSRQKEKIIFPKREVHWLLLTKKGNLKITVEIIMEISHRTS